MEPGKPPATCSCRLEARIPWLSGTPASVSTKPDWRDRRTAVVASRVRARVCFVEDEDELGDDASERARKP